MAGSALDLSGIAKKAVKGRKQLLSGRQPQLISPDGDSRAYSPVDPLTQEVRVPVMAGVLQEHVHHHHPQ
jgi:hypothetical protein